MVMSAGYILSDQVKCLDWRARRVELIAHLPDSVLAQVWNKIEPLFPTA